MSYFTRFLKWASAVLVVWCLPLVAAALVLQAASTARGSEISERVAVLFAADDQALYRIDPDSGEFTKIGDLEVGPAVIGLGGQMVYDSARQKLYAVASLSSPHATPAIIEIDPANAEEKIVWQGEDEGNFGISYDPANATLYTFGLTHLIAEGVSSFDPSGGQFGASTTAIALGDSVALTFDPRRHVWTKGNTDNEVR